MSTVKYRVFSMAEKTERKNSFFGIPVTNGYPKYSNTKALYDDVSEFATSLGSNLINISGTAHGVVPDGWLCGDVVVWYREQA